MPVRLIVRKNTILLEGSIAHNSLLDEFIFRLLSWQTPPEDILADDNTEGKRCVFGVGLLSLKTNLRQKLFQAQGAQVCVQHLHKSWVRHVNR